MYVIETSFEYPDGKIESRNIYSTIEKAEEQFSTLKNKMLAFFETGFRAKTIINKNVIRCFTIENDYCFFKAELKEFTELDSPIDFSFIGE